jgi:acylphosphatase
VGDVVRRFIVSGKVQGVHFRHSTRLEAQRLGLHGSARNLPNGTVEVIVQGEPEPIETLREWLKRGPSLARVSGVEESSAGEAQPQPAASPFEIL